jgi:hypothetical protein
MQSIRESAGAKTPSEQRTADCIAALSHRLLDAGSFAQPYARNE